MVFPGSRPAAWTMALALTVCLCGSVVRGSQDKPAPASAKDSSAARSAKNTETPKTAPAFRLRGVLPPRAARRTERPDRLRKRLPQRLPR